VVADPREPAEHAVERALRRRVLLTLDEIRHRLLDRAPR
jgi:hypothetical protein